MKEGVSRTKKPYLAIRNQPVLTQHDYPFRPRQLEDFPLYFFMSACEAALRLDENSMQWVTVGNQRQASFMEEPMKCKLVPELPLLDSAGRPLHKYAYYQ